MSELVPAEGEYFRHFLRRIRRERGLTLVDAMGQLGVTKRSFVLWESGRRAPQVTRVPQLAQFLGISDQQVRELLGATAECGTVRGFHRHCRFAVDPCEACREARQEADRELRRRKGVKPQKIAACGTYGGYYRHLRHGEETCAACRAAAAAAEMARKRRKGVKPRNFKGKAGPLVHLCPGCGAPTAQYRWCDGCLCASVNAKGRRCRNVASSGDKCDYHAETDGQLAS